MRSSTAEMVEKKVLEMAQHASFHQHVSYNLSTILHALTAGKTDPAEIAEAFSRAKGLEVITRVVSGEPVARPPVVGLCCAVARRVVDKYGNGVAEEQAGGLVEAVVIRLGRGISGDDAQAVECQVECARLMCTMAGRAASVLTGGGALAAIEGMLERLGGKHRPGSSSGRRRRSLRPYGFSRTPSLPTSNSSLGPRYASLWGKGDRRSIMRPCCEALERVSRTEDGRTVFEERGTGGVLLATIRDFPEALEEGSDAALAAALKVVERIFTGKSPEACILSLRARAEEESTDDPHVPTTCDYSSCVETVLAVAEATPEAPGAAAATCLWWLSGASSVASDRALSSLLTAAVAAEPGDEGEGEGGKRAIGEGGGERKDADSEAVAKPTTGDVWSWFPRRGGEEEEDEEEGEVVTDARPLEAARFLATLCLYRPGLKVLEAGVRRKEPHALEALLRLSASDDPRLARACFRILERLGGRGSSIGAQTLVDAGTLEVATEAGKRFEVVVDVEEVHDDEANAIAAALGTVAVLAEAGGASARPVIDEAFQLSVRCLGRVGEFSGRPAAAAAKAALDVITFRLTRPDRPKGPAVTRPGGVSLPSAEDGVIAPGDSGGRDEEADKTAAPAIEKSSSFSVGDYAVDTPMEVLKDADAILAAMKAHPSDARVQQSGWKSLLAMDTGRGGSQRAVPGAGDGYQSRRQMLRDCLERHGGESLVAGQVADILDGLGLHTDSDGEQSLTASLSDHPHGEDSPRPRTDGEDSLPTAVDGGGVENESGGVSPQGPDIKGKKESHEFSSERAPVAGDTGAATTTTTTATDPAVEAPSEAEACASGEGREGDDAEQPLEVPVPEKPASGEGVGVVEVVKGGEGDCNNAGVEEAVGDGEADGDVEGSAQGDAGDDGTGTEGLSSDDVAVDDMEEHRPVEDVLAELSLSGQKALEGSDTSSPGAPPAFGDHLLPVSGGSPSIGRSNIIRSLFSDDDGQGEEGGGEEGEEEEEEEVQREMGAEENEQDVEEDASVESLPVPVVPSKDEIELQSSWAELERLYGDVLGRSHILGGESAETVAAMPDPSVLREGIGAMLEGADGGKSRDAFATMSLAMVGALTAATGALACSQKEVQRYLKMSRDLRETSTWKDISEAMQWTMDSLKGTVILFTPHTGQGLTRDLGLCKNMESASKLFKEAALQIKIVVVELAGEHQVNTVWRIGPGIFEGLPDKRKIMVLRQLRSLVVAYDHLSDDRRKELTTALEIIKNREVLNRMGKCCVQAEALDEKRREAKLASADDRLRVGTRRPSSTRHSSVERSPLSTTRASTNTPPNGPLHDSVGSFPPRVGSTPHRKKASRFSNSLAGAFTPPSGKDSPGSYANKFSATTTTTPGSSRKGAHESPRSVRSTDSASTGAATSVSGGTSVSGAASATGSTSVTGATTSTTGATTSATGANTSTTGATTSATGSTTSATSGAAAGGSGIPRARGAAFTPRRRDSVAQQQQQQRAPRSRSPVTRLARSMATPASRSKSPMPRSGRSIPSPSPRSRSPVPRSARSAASPAASRSKSPVPGTARSRQSLASPASTPRSPVPRPRGSKPSGSKPLPRSPAPRSKLGLTASPQLALGS